MVVTTVSAARLSGSPETLLGNPYYIPETFLTKGLNTQASCNSSEKVYFNTLLPASRAWLLSAGQARCLYVRWPFPPQGCGAREKGMWKKVLGQIHSFQGHPKVSDSNSLWPGDNRCPSLQLSQCQYYTCINSKTPHYYFMRQKPPKYIRSNP